MQNPQDIVKALSFGSDAKDKVFTGIDKLTQAVSSTLGASGKCVILEDFMGRPMITKDGVTVANSVNLRDPVENIGATLIKEAARKTVSEAGDGTTTATVLAHSLLKEANNKQTSESLRKIKEDIQKACDSTIKYLEKVAVPVEGDMIDQVATISSNNDKELGSIIGEAFKQVGKNGTVMMDADGKSGETTVEVVSGSQINQGYTNQNFVTDTGKQTVTLEKPLILLVSSPISVVRKIQVVLEYAVTNNRPILIIGELEKQPMSALIMNKIKGNIKANVIAPPGFNFWKKDFLDDIAAVTGATHINEEYGDDIDLITPDMLGECERAISDSKSTVLKVKEIPEEAKERIAEIEEQLKSSDPSLKTQKLEERLAILSGNVAVISVGANSDVELKEKKDRVDDAIHATKAAVKEGIVPGGGVALLNAANNIKEKSDGTEIFIEAIKYPYKNILENAGLEYIPQKGKGKGINVVTGKTVDMIKEGIIDPLLVTKSALKNAVSVASTILSTDCVISNMREE
jgi:chaperonin GroEL